jgi:hypothetical protein
MNDLNQNWRFRVRKMRHVLLGRLLKEVLYCKDDFLQTKDAQTNGY